MLLSPTSGKVIADCLETPEIEQEIERAILQVERALKSKKELKEEKVSIDKATNHTKAE